MKYKEKFSNLGFGLGLRHEHYEAILTERPKIDWFEILTENYLIPGGKPLYFLEKIRQNYPLVLHGVSMSLGSCDPIDWAYLKQVKNLAHRIEARWISDHLCWTGVHGIKTHDLLPLPYTKESIKHLTQRIEQIQDFLGQPLLIENVSSYVSFKQSEMAEWEFLKEICLASDCYLLLDVNNIYVSSRNHSFNPEHYLNGIPVNRVRQIHLAGHSDMGDYIIDTHDHPIITPVWNLYAKALERFGFIPTMIERDDHIPPLHDLLIELDHARDIANNILLREKVG